MGMADVKHDFLTNLSVVGSSGIYQFAQEEDGKGVWQVVHTDLSGNVTRSPLTTAWQYDFVFQEIVYYCSNLHDDENNKYYVYGKKMRGSGIKSILSSHFCNRKSKLWDIPQI